VQQSLTVPVRRLDAAICWKNIAQIPQKLQIGPKTSGKVKGCRNEDLAITVCKPESRKKACYGILLRLLDHSHTLTLVSTL
jgi:hypothetical protein